MCQETKTSIFCRRVSFQIFKCFRIVRKVQLSVSIAIISETARQTIQLGPAGCIAPHILSLGLFSFSPGRFCLIKQKIWHLLVSSQLLQLHTNTHTHTRILRCRARTTELHHCFIWIKLQHATVIYLHSLGVCVRVCV